MLAQSARASAGNKTLTDGSNVFGMHWPAFGLHFSIRGLIWVDSRQGTTNQDGQPKK
jgi:hypothetical protein